MEDLHGPRATAEALFRAVYADTQPDVLRFVTRRVCPSHAEDVVAEVFLVVWRRLAELPTGRSDARAWIFGVARGVLLNTQRGERRQEALEIRLTDASTGRVQGLAQHGPCGGWLWLLRVRCGLGRWICWWMVIPVMRRRVWLGLTRARCGVGRVWRVCSCRWVVSVGFGRPRGGAVRRGRGRWVRCRWLGSSWMGGVG